MEITGINWWMSLGQFSQSPCLLLSTWQKGTPIKNFIKIRQTVYFTILGGRRKGRTEGRTDELSTPAVLFYFKKGSAILITSTTILHTYDTACYFGVSQGSLLWAAANRPKAWQPHLAIRGRPTCNPVGIAVDLWGK